MLYFGNIFGVSSAFGRQQTACNRQGPSESAVHVHPCPIQSSTMANAHSTTGEHSDLDKERTFNARQVCSMSNSTRAPSALSVSRSHRPWQ